MSVIPLVQVIEALSVVICSFEEFEYIQKLSNPEVVIEEWEKIFSDVVYEKKTINRKTSKILLGIENFIANTLEKLVYVKKMRQKNIDSWGEEQYEKLIRK